MKSILLNLLGIVIVVSAGVAMAQYPNMTEEEMQALEGYNAMLPPVEFAETPTSCEPDDPECQKLYLDVYGAHFHGSMTAQQDTSPIYSWNSNKCILNSDQCDILQGEWEMWVNKANSGALDFSQENCIDVGGTWFGLEPAYNCYEYK